MQHEMNFIFVDTDNITPPHAMGTGWDTRTQFYKDSAEGCSAKVSVCILGYNRLEKTKSCIENVMKYTKNVNYRLVLIDNGSSDSTLEYYKSVEYHDKVIIQISKNLNASFAFNKALSLLESEYIVVLPNDIIVTKNWLFNLITCMESDNKIGFVTPMSSNASNYQEINFTFTNMVELQKKAAVFNISNPAKWQERMRLVNLVTVLRKEVIENIGLFDVGFFHDFGEDDYSARIRRAGYKLILCGDTFVHHDHDFRNYEDKNQTEFLESIHSGKENYRQKYYGIDAWDDINNFELHMMRLLTEKNDFPKVPSILGIDVRCGTPILEVRNILRSKGIMESISSAYTTNAKFFYDLQCVTEGNTICDRIDFISEYYKTESYDIVVIGEPVNTYAEPVRITENALSFLRKGGKLLLKLRNTLSVHSFLHMVGLDSSGDGDMPVQISFDDFNSCLKLMEVKNIEILNEPYKVEEDAVDELVQAMHKTGICRNPERSVEKMNVRDFIFLIEK